MKTYVMYWTLFVLAVVHLPSSSLKAKSNQRGESISYELQLGEIEFTHRSGYVLVSLPDAAYDASPGYPLIPFIITRHILPQGTRCKDVYLEIKEQEILQVKAPLYPAQIPRPLSQNSVEFAQPIREVYSSTSPTTDFSAQAYNEGFLGGQRIVTVAIRPIRYTPASGILEVVKSMIVTVEYEACDDGHTNQPSTVNQSKNLSRRIQYLTDDSPTFSTLPMSTTIPPEVGYRHVIVTPAALKPAFSELAAWNTERGVRDTVVTLESITSVFPGQDIAEQIRNFVIFAYTNLGLEYLLLGGDEELVPTRDCFTMVSGGGDLDTIPTDMYFGCLDGNWDGNGNGVFGEMGDNVDLYAEVAVGRAPVNDATEATRFTDKVKTYTQTPAAGYANKLLLPSEILWDDPYYPGDATNNRIAELAPAGAEFQRLYETQGTLSKFGFRDSLNIGVGLAHHMAHGNVSAISCADAGFWGWEASLLTNADRLTVFNSIACLVGAFDYSECLVEEFMNSPDGGTVAWVGNSRYGWGTPPTQGPSEDLDISLFEAIWSGYNPEIGPALVQAKDENAAGMSGSTYGRWCIYELNLHGDPAMPVHSREPSNFFVTYPEILDGPQTVTIRVTSETGYDVAGMLVCFRQSPSVYSWDYTDDLGYASLNINPQPGYLDLTVTGANHFAYTDKISVGFAEPEISLDEDTVWVDAGVDPLSAFFGVSNTGTGPLWVSKARSLATWIEDITPESFWVLPDSTIDVGFSVDTSGLADGIWTGKIMVSSNDPSARTIYQYVKLIKGDFPNIAFTVDTLKFDIPAGDSSTKLLQVTNLGRADLIVSNVTDNVLWITEINPTNFTVPYGNSSSTEWIAVTVDTLKVGEGEYYGIMTFSTNDPDEKISRLPVLLDMGEPDIAPSPDTLEFFYSYVELDENKTEDTLKVINAGKRLLSLTRIDDTKPWIEIQAEVPQDIEPSDTFLVPVKVFEQGLKQGVYYGHIVIYSNDPDSPILKQPCKFTIEEIPATILCSPDTAEMDRQTMRGIFWIHNLGMRSLTVTGITSPTPWIGRFYPNKGSVQGADSLRIQIIGDASKLTGGVQIGTAVIESNDSHKPEYSEPVRIETPPGIAEAYPRFFEFSRISPNPVAVECLIRFAVPFETPVEIAVYDISGKKVKTLNYGSTNPGYYSIPWKGDDEFGRELPQGVYILKMSSPEYSAIQKIVLVR